MADVTGEVKQDPAKKVTTPTDSTTTAGTDTTNQGGATFLDEVRELTGGGAAPGSQQVAEVKQPPAGQTAEVKQPPAGQGTETTTPTGAVDTAKGDTPAPTGNVLFEDPAEPPATTGERSVTTPAERTAPAQGDALAGVIDPNLKAAVDSKIGMLVQHVENGAKLLSQGKVDETVNAYKAAADLVSPDEQKIFLQEQKRVAELIKQETQKPQDQQDGKKLEAMKQLERNLRTLGLVDMFTEVNSGLIYTQAGNTGKASECFARAFINEKSLVDQKLLPPEGYLSKEPNLGARINEIYQRQGINVWKLMGEAVKTAGVDPQLVGIDMGRGPPGTPVRTETGTTPEALPGQTPERQTGQPAERQTGQPAEAPRVTDQTKEPAIVLSPTDAGGKTPVERVGFWMDKALADKQLTDETKNQILAAIADADKGRSPKLQELLVKQQQLDAQKESFLDARVGNTQETARDAVGRINKAVLGEFEEKQENGQTVLVKTKDGLIDKMNPPSDYKGPDEIKTAMPPADYKASAAKPADFKGTDEEFRVQQYRSDLRTQTYRREVKQMYGNLDEAMSEEQYKSTLDNLKKIDPNNKAFNDLLTERDSVTTQVRTALIPLNLTSAKIPAEQNQSAMARAMYADLLLQAGDEAGAKKYFTEAYATNQVREQTEEFRTMAMQAGIDPVTLLKAAVEQNKLRGGGQNQKCLEVEDLLKEANLIYMAAPQDKKAEVANSLKDPMIELQKMSDREYSQVLQRSAGLTADYQKLLPTDQKLKDELKGIERSMVTAEQSFKPNEVQLVSVVQNPKAPADQREAARTELAKTQPDWVKNEARFREILGANTEPYKEARAKMGMHILNINTSAENLFYSRAIQSNMLNETGDKAGAKAKLQEGFAAVPKAMRDALFKERPMVGQLVTAVGLDQAAMLALPEPTVKAAPQEVTPQMIGGQTPGPGGTPERQTGQTGQPAPAGEVQRPEGQQPTPEAPVEGQRKPGTDPRFDKMSNKDLEQKINEKAGDLEQVEEVKAMYKELMARYDGDLTKEEWDSAIPSMALLSEALKQGKALTGPENNRVIGTEALTPEGRWGFHRAVFADQESMNNQIRVRQEYAQFLKASGQYADAEKMGIEARDLAEKLMKPVEVNGKQVRPIDLMKQEASKLLEDMAVITDPVKRQEMQKAHIILMGRDVDSGAIKTPINTNKFLAQLYLGTEVVPKLNAQGQIEGIQDIKFGQSSAFKPQKAIETADKALQYTREILNIDPLDAKTAKENPGVASLFGALAEIVDNPDKYKLYVGKKGETFVGEDGKTRYLQGGELVGKNDKGIPILIEAHSVDNIKKQIKKDSAFDSVLTDALVTVGVVGTIALSRNPKVLAFFEKGLGKYGSHAGSVVKVAGYGTALTGGLLGRHYGYKALTGVDESWSDSAVHMVGSLAAAEVGGRLSGRGSFITGASGGPRQFARFGTTESAQFYAKQGYETTGQLMDLLKSQGFINEAKAFVNMDRGTKIMMEAGKVDPKVAQALERAQLTGVRTGAVAEAIVKDAKLARVKQPVLAEKLSGIEGAPKTVGDLERMVQADQEGLQALHKRLESVGADLPKAERDKIKVADALKDVTGPEGQQMMAIAEKYGLKRVGQVDALGAETEKIGFDKVFPKLSEMRSANLINSGTKLTDAVSMGTHVLEGPGMQRLLSMVPATERSGILTESALKEVMAASPITGERSVLSRLKDGGIAVRDGTVTTWKTVTTKEGWNTMRTAVGETLAPLGTKKFYTTTAPGAIGDGFMWGATKLNNGRKFVTQRFELRQLDPAAATPEALSRARFASGFYGALGAAGTYNTVVKPYDLTGQVFGMTVPQIGGDGRPHAVYNDTNGNDYTWFNALKESHFPTIEGLDANQLPWYAKPLVPIASGVVGTPGQAFFGAYFLQPGAIYKPIWSNPETSTFRKSMQSFFPLSPTRWNNWNAGVFSGPTMGTAGVFAGTALPNSVDGIGPRMGVGRYKDLLRNAQRPIENTTLPKQRPSLSEVQDQTPTRQQATPPQTGGDKTPTPKGKTNPPNPNEVEPPPPGQGG